MQNGNEQQKFGEPLSDFSLRSLSGPTVIDILNAGQHVAVHAVVPETAIFRTIAQLKALGGAGILVTRIERLMP